MLSLDHKGSAEVSSKPSRTLETSVGQFDLSHIRSNKVENCDQSCKTGKTCVIVYFAVIIFERFFIQL